MVWSVRVRTRRLTVPVYPGNRCGNKPVMYYINNVVNTGNLCATFTSLILTKIYPIFGNDPCYIILYTDSVVTEPSVQ